MRASKASLRAFVSERRPGNKRCVGPRACTTGKKTGAQFSINAPAQARRSSGHYLGSAVPHSRHSFGSLSCNREVFAFLGFRCQWRTRRRGEGDAATDKLVKGAGFHYAARQTKVQTVTRCQPEDGIVTHQVLIAFTGCASQSSRDLTMSPASFL
ncbi:Uncharacterised protein [Escherichia coli]|uniref:Uncharacterized protein n=1 Tax=Escherichia coli TaxID=562 RepID=A0A2X3LZ33_ECOLX|nr:Uncharacterised protein [Escherichia coli]